MESVEEKTNQPYYKFQFNIFEMPSKLHVYVWRAFKSIRNAANFANCIARVFRVKMCTVRAYRQSLLTIPLRTILALDMGGKALKVRR